jgi:hypothetical protein
MITEDNAGINKNDIKSWKCDIPKKRFDKIWALTGREILCDNTLLLLWLNKNFSGDNNET